MSSKIALQNREFCKNLEMRANLASISIIDLVNELENSEVLQKTGSGEITFESFSKALIFHKYSYFVTIMNNVYDGQHYENYDELDVTDWDTSNVKTMRGLFSQCVDVKYIKGINNWDLSKVTDLGEMFNHCEHLESIDLTNWDITNVKRMDGLFQNCYKLKNIKGLNTWNTEKVECIDYMFRRDLSLKEIDLTGWKFDSIEYANCAFGKCKNLENIDGILEADLSNIEDKFAMFAFCPKLDKKYAALQYKFRVSDQKELDDIFKNSSIVID